LWGLIAVANVNIGTSGQSGGAFGGEKKRVAEENQDLMLESLYETPNQHDQLYHKFTLHKELNLICGST
jgi:hypothetical protein